MSGIQAYDRGAPIRSEEHYELRIPLGHRHPDEADRYRDDRPYNGVEYDDRLHSGERYQSSRPRRSDYQEYDYRKREPSFSEFSREAHRPYKSAGMDPLRDRRDYPPPGVDNYDTYHNEEVREPSSRNRHERHHDRRASRDYGRDYDRPSPDSREYRDRSPLSSRNSDRLDDRYPRHDDDMDRCGENFMTNSPTNTVLIRGLPVEVDEKDILMELGGRKILAKDVRLMRKKSSGVSRGFAFIEFKTTEDARKWMDDTQGFIRVRGQMASLYYSSPKMQTERLPDGTDWICSKCCAHNFKRRDQCYICGLSRAESERTKGGDGYDQIGSNPCNTLILRGLDALTTEATLRKAIRTASKKKPKSLKVMTDPLTGTSLCYAFAEFASVKDAQQILESLQNPDYPFEVDGKLILAAYAKNTFSTILTSIEAASYQNVQQQQWDYQRGHYYDYNDYYQQHSYPQQNHKQQFTKDKSTNSAAALAQAAILQAQAAKTSHVTPPEQANTTIYPTPDISTYQYDATSGFYYDPSTGLYYDAQTQYYYNNQTSQYFYWCAEKSTFLPAPTNTTTTDAASTANTSSTAATDDAGDTKKDKDKKEKAKVAKKIAKNMEKWAKSQNNAKNAMKQMFESSPAPVTSKIDMSSKSADAGFSMFEKIKPDTQLMPPPPTLPGANTSQSDTSGLVASYGGDSDDDDSAITEDTPVSDEAYLNWDKLICKLCKRQFNSQDILRKHRDLSDLHKQNLAKLIMSKPLAAEKKSEAEKYRDRAAERRQKYGAPTPPEVEKKVDFPAPLEIAPPTARQSAVANKMMQKMGWSEGQGLGKGHQGIIDPIEAKIRSATAGLGSRGATYNAPAGSGSQYKEAGKATMMARYHELS